MHSVLIIVLNYNGFEDTRNCIISLRKLDYSNFQIIIIDNYSNDGSFENLSNTFPEIPIIRSVKNLGYAGGMNIGIKHGLDNNFDYFLLLNNDTLHEPDFLKNMINLSESDSKIGLVSPKVLYMHNPEKIYCAGAEMNWMKCCSVAQYRHQNSSTNALENREISIAEGSCILIKKEVFLKVGLFDEKYFMYFEDMDYSLRVNKYFKIFFSADSIIYHKAGAGSVLKNYSALYLYYYTRNRIYAFKNQSFFYQVYVYLFSTTTFFIKYFSIAGLSFNDNELKKVSDKLEKLSLGFWDGTKIFLSNQNSMRDTNS